MSFTPSTPPAERVTELHSQLAEVREQIKQASSSRKSPSQPILVAVSKYKPVSDILACYEAGQRDFGENYVQELVEKAEQLPRDIRWHFIGTLQSNKAKIIAAIPNLYALHTLASIKAANTLNKALPDDRPSPLNVLLQVNTSGEDSKSGVAPMPETGTNGEDSELVQLAKYITTSCPRLRLLGLMTIGSITESLSSSEHENKDFETLRFSCEMLQGCLGPIEGKWGAENGKLLLSMGMSSDFEAAIRAGSGIVRVGTGIFGERPKKAT